MARKMSGATWSAYMNKQIKFVTSYTDTVFQNILLEFFDVMFNNTPVVTGNLRNSLHATVSTNAVSVTGAGLSNSEIATFSGYNQSIANIMTAEVGDTVRFAYLATYGPRVNYGFNGFDSLGRFYSQNGQFFLERSASQFLGVARRVAKRFRMEMK